MIRMASGSYSYNNGLVIRDVSFELRPGDLTAVIGPNGSGKTTLLRLLSGALVPRSGSVSLGDQPLATVGHRDLALQLAMVPQEVSLPFPFMVRELVELGRTPHRDGRWLGGLDERDTVAVDEALAAAGIGGLAKRPVNELSGGERQRAIIAMALAQEPRYLLLDEPTTHLDIQHQVEVLDLLVRLNRERGIAILATMHDLNLAALYFRRIVMLDHGRLVSQGNPSDVLSAQRLGEVFQTAVRVSPHPVTGVPTIVVVPGGQAPNASPSTQAATPLPASAFAIQDSA